MQNGVEKVISKMEPQDKIVNNKMLQSFKQLFDSKTSPDTMSHLILSTVFVVSLIGALILLLLPSYSNIQCATSFIFGQNNHHAKEEDSTKTPDDDFGTSIIWRGRQKTALNPELEKEALVSLNVAMDMYAQGKNDKALKLFQHAIALDPKHADILNEYGEFIEKYKKDIVLANHLYCKALIASPTHSKALANSERTLPLVEEIDQSYFSRIDNKRAELYKIPANHPGLRRAKKEAYFLHIYHTNAIEGNTLTLQQTRAIVETKMAIGGKSLQEQSEVVGIDSAMSFMNNSLLGKVGQLSLNDILEIHKRVLGFVDPIEAGRIRRTQVFVGNFRPPHPKHVEKLMHEFIYWLNSEEASKMHPIEYAALAHYKLVSIHPFYDGNGRTSRLLMNLILMQAGFPPVSIKVEDRFRYYDTLELANEGDIRPFIRFIAECAERTLDEFLLATVENPSSYETLSLTSIPNSLYSGHQQMVILAQP